MEYSNIQQLLDQSIEFPITHGRLDDQLGAVELTAPTGDSVPLSEVLARADESEYGSSEILYTAIIGNLDETFIGRKYYDDRSGCQTSTDPRDHTRRSF